MSVLLDMRVIHEIVECHDPAHGHNSPYQEMFAGWHNGHYIQVTIDGPAYNVRIDDGIAKFDISRDAAAAYVERMTA